MHPSINPSIHELINLSIYYPNLSFPILLILSYPMLSYAILCYPMLSYAILCYPMLSYAILCYPMLSYAILCYPMLSYAILSYAILSYPSMDLSFYLTILLSIYLASRTSLEHLGTRPGAHGADVKPLL